MPLCGFKPGMLKGLTMFAQGLYEAAVDRAEMDHIGVEAAMKREISEMNVFLAALDEKYEELRETTEVDEAMRALVSWAELWRSTDTYEKPESRSS